MGYRRFSRLTGASENPPDTWMYQVDTEAEVTTSLPDECRAVVVATPGAGKVPVRIRATDGTWKELKKG